MESDGESPPLRLRGTSVLAAPLAVVAIMSLAVSVASASWAGFRGRDLGVGVVAVILVPVIVGAASLAAVRGCFVEVSGGVVRDVAAWITLRRVPQDGIVTARVRRGPWRLYVLELGNGSAVKLVGASPQQFPAHLLPDARTHDLEDLEVLLGPEPS